MKCNESNIQWHCIAWRKIGQDGIIAAMSTAAPPKQKHPQLQRLGDAIRARRKALGHSQEAFADVVGLDRGYMGGIERGEHNLALVNILKIIRALGLQPSEFFKALDMVEERPAASGGAEPPSPGALVAQDQPAGNARSSPSRHKEALKDLANLLVEEAYQQLLERGAQAIDKQRR